jgi:serine/threonine-protein kinase
MLVGQTIGSGANRFDIEQELGSGAMGTVYRAQWFHEGKARLIALKVVALGLLGNENAMARFERESNILKQLRHPHIVKLYASGTYRKTPFIAMEFIDGEALDRVLARRGRLGWEEVLAYGKQLCEALQYAHEKGIIHRDLKPSNLMITSEGILKLTDFGIAKDTDVTALTGQNSTIGTAAYMSPEQCKGDRNLTFKSDLYSLGVVFFELLSGKKPFYADTTVDMFLKHVNEPPPRIGKLVEGLPTKLEALVLQLLAKDKEDRPLDAAWVVRMLNEIEEDAFARRSVGLDVATSRRGSRNSDGSRLDEDDRDAARALRGKKKKKKKGERVPFLQQPAVKASAILLLLAVMAGGVFYALKPPSAEKLSSAIDSSASPEAKLEAATKYLERYGEKSGEPTDRAAAIFREGKTREREKVMTNRFSSGLSKPTENDDAEAYSLAWKALELEKAGDLKHAAEYWERLRAKFQEDAKRPYTLKEDELVRARWGWLAQKRLADLKKVEQLAASLRQKIADNRKYEVAFSADPSSPEGLAIRGFRLEDFEDRDQAAQVWDQLATFTDKDPATREWHLLGNQQRALVPKSTGDALPARRERIVKKLDEARALGEKIDKITDGTEVAQKARLREMCREIIDLYRDEQDSAIKTAVQKARELLLAHPKT